jgi:hypothetical protein
MRDVRGTRYIKIEPASSVLVNREMVLHEASLVNWRSDGEVGEHLWQRRIAMAQVIDYCTGIGLDVGCQANKIVPEGAVHGRCLGIEHDRRPSFMQPRSRWTCDAWGDGLRLKQGTNALDWVFAGHVLEDQPFPNGTVQMLRELHRVVKNGGHVLLLLPHARYYPNVGQPGANPAHQRDWLPEELDEFVRMKLPGMLSLVQLESFYNNFEFDAVWRVVKDNDRGRTGHHTST